jgi:serine protease Do
VQVRIALEQLFPPGARGGRRACQLGCLVLAWVALALVVEAEEKERDTYNIKNAFRAAVSRPLQSTVRVLYQRPNGSAEDWENAALGTIVDADGYILTKASELKGDRLLCKLHDGTRLDAQLVGVSEDYDLAMLKVEAHDLPVIEWSEAPPPPVGSWLATLGMEQIPVAIGVVSTAPRAIERNLPALGIILDEGDDGRKIHEVVPNSGAAQAGVQANDVVTHLNGIQVKGREELIRKIHEFRPGDKVKLTILRGTKEQTVEVVLGELAQLTLGHRDQIQNTIGGPLSERRAGFPTALEHDTVLKPNQCGGPLIDLDGKAVGINIARNSRVGSLAIPIRAIRPLLDELKSGKLVTTTPAN